MTDPNCKICEGDGWVCENHPDKAWKGGDGCCGGAGMLCVCNPQTSGEPETPETPETPESPVPSDG